MATVSSSIHLSSQTFQTSSPNLDIGQELKDLTGAFAGAEEYWSEHAKKLTPASRDLFLGMISGMFQSYLAELQSLLNKVDNKNSLEKFREETKNSLSVLNDTAKSFLRNRAVYQEQKDKTLNQIDDFDSELQGSRLSFGSFDSSSIDNLFILTSNASLSAIPPSRILPDQKKILSKEDKDKALKVGEAAVSKITPEQPKDSRDAIIEETTSSWRRQVQRLSPEKKRVVCQARIEELGGNLKKNKKIHDEFGIPSQDSFAVIKKQIDGHNETMKKECSYKDAPGQRIDLARKGWDLYLKRVPEDRKSDCAEKAKFFVEELEGSDKMLKSFGYPSHLREYEIEKESIELNKKFRAQCPQQPSKFPED